MRGYEFNGYCIIFTGNNLRQSVGCMPPLAKTHNIGMARAGKYEIIEGGLDIAEVPCRIISKFP